MVSPFGIPLPRRPLCKEWPKGETHPHCGEKGKVFSPTWSLGEWRKPSVVCPLGHILCKSFFFPLTDGQKAAAVAPGRRQVAGMGARLGSGLGFLRYAPKAKGILVCPPPTLYLRLIECGKAAYVSEHSSGFATPSAPRGSPSRWLPGADQNSAKRKGWLKEKSGVAVRGRDVEYVHI